MTVRPAHTGIEGVSSSQHCGLFIRQTYHGLAHEHSVPVQDPRAVADQVVCVPYHASKEYQQQGHPHRDDSSDSVLRLRELDKLGRNSFNVSLSGLAPVHFLHVLCRAYTALFAAC